MSTLEPLEIDAGKLRNQTEILNKCFVSIFTVKDTDVLQ